MKKDTTIIVLITSLLLAPFALQSAHAQTEDEKNVEGQVNITSTCGLAFVGGDSINFGDVARDGLSSEETLTLDNTGSVTGTVNVSAKDWKSEGGTVHIAGEKTKFATTNVGTGDYASKTALNSTDTPILFGTITPPTTNATFWELSATDMLNLPFTGALTQAITFSMTC